MNRSLWRAAGVVMTAAALGNCSRSESDSMPAPDASAPVIERVDPASGRAGTAYPIQATIHGRGFDAEGNTIRFGQATVRNRPSTAGGTQILFSVPKQQGVGPGAPPMELLPGEYPVVVIASGGTSNAVTFTLTRSDRLDAGR